MKIEDQVVSLELARKLKELGVKQESYFWWTDYGMPHIMTDTSIFYEHTKKQRCYSAFTAAELGELLPEKVTEKRNEEVFGENCKSHNLQYDFWTEPTGHNYGVERKYRCSIGKKQFIETTETHARAKMLIYLVENKLI